MPIVLIDNDGKTVKTKTVSEQTLFYLHVDVATCILHEGKVYIYDGHDGTQLIFVETRSFNLIDLK